VPQKTSRLWFTITWTQCERILIFLAKVLPIKQAIKRLYCATSNDLCFCTTWQNGETRKLHFSLIRFISALPEFNQLFVFLNVFDSRLILTLLYDSLNLVINAFSWRLLGAWFRINEVKSAAEVGLCFTHNAPMRCLLGFQITFK